MQKVAVFLNVNRQEILSLPQAVPPKIFPKIVISVDPPTPLEKFVLNPSTSRELVLPSTSSEGPVLTFASKSESNDKTTTIDSKKTGEKRKVVMAADSAIRIVEIREFSRGINCEDYNFALKSEKGNPRPR